MADQSPTEVQGVDLGVLGRLFPTSHEPTCRGCEPRLGARQPDGAVPAALHLAALVFDPSYPVELENAMTKRHPKQDPRRRVTAIAILDLQRVRWIEPIQRTADWWPVPGWRGPTGGQ